MKQRETIVWPAVQAGASLMSVFGGLLGLCFVPENRTNPFFYTSIINPAIYAGINLYRCHEISQRNKSFAEAEMEKIEVVIGR